MNVSNQKYRKPSQLYSFPLLLVLSLMMVFVFTTTASASPVQQEDEPPVEESEAEEPDLLAGLDHEHFLPLLIGEQNDEEDIAALASIRYPSGQSFQIFSSVPGANGKYKDPNRGGVGIIRVQGKDNVKLSKNFVVKELRTRDGAPYARISRSLVSCLQKIRNKAGAPITVISGYRHPAYNQRVGGARLSQHQSGKAADISSSAVSPLRLADIAVASCGCKIGIGLGSTNIHVDVRGRLTTWTYAGAALSSSSFASRVANQCR